MTNCNDLAIIMLLRYESEAGTTTYSIIVTLGWTPDNCQSDKQTSQVSIHMRHLNNDISFINSQCHIVH